MADILALPVVQSLSLNPISPDAAVMEGLASRSPDWLAALRRASWERAKRIPFPNSKEEHWRYTELALLKPEQYETRGIEAAESLPGRMPDEAQAMLRAAGAPSAGQLLQGNGVLYQETLSAEAARKGVVFTSIEHALVEHDELLRSRLGSLVGADDFFAARSLALHRGGAFLYVPRGVELDAPFQMLSSLSLGGMAFYPRNIVVVEEGARILFHDLYTSPQPLRPTFVAPVTEIYLGQGANMGWVTWQGCGGGVRYLARSKVHLSRNAVLNTLLVALGADFSRSWLEVLLAEEGAESVMLGLCFPQGRQEMEHWTVQDHQAPRTRSDLMYKGALAGESRSIYYGTIRVRPGARKTDAYQVNRNLLLSLGANAETNPQLEIANNDVRCTHGASVGPIDELQLFYLRSRGIPREEAERLIVLGFFNEVLERAQWSKLSDQLARAIRAKAGDR